VVVRFFASLRDITQERKIECDPCPSTLRELLRQLSDRYGPGFERWVFEGEDMADSILIVINGQDARHRAGLETRLGSADVISILPMMAGGLNPASMARVGD
jgi:MoaD family protein